MISAQPVSNYPISALLDPIIIHIDTPLENTKPGACLQFAGTPSLSEFVQLQSTAIDTTMVFGGTATLSDGFNAHTVRAQYRSHTMRASDDATIRARYRPHTVRGSK